MADEVNPQGQGEMPPKQSPLKAAGPSTGAAPKTILLRRPTLRRPGEPAATPAKPADAAPATPVSPAFASVAHAAASVSPISLAKPADAPAAPASPITLAKPADAATPASPIRPASPISPIRPVATPVAKPLSETAQVAQGIAISHTEAAKKMTSRISVSSATSSIPPIAPAADSAATHAAKKMTSRITLEAAFNTQPDMPASQPKTIRLKRPSEVISAAKPPAPPPPPEAASSAPLPDGMSPIPEEPPAKEGDEQMTRRKTIKVKRPGAGGGPKISIPHSGEGSSPAPIGDENLQSLSGFSVGASEAPAPDKVNPIFVIAAVVAIAFGSILLWTLLSQAYGERGAAGDFALPAGPVISPPPGLSTFN